MSRLGDALFTRTQRQVLGLMYTRPEKSFYTKEILRLSGMGVATIKRELDSMVAAGILTFSKQGNQHHYQANPDCPIYHELQGIVKKTFGIVDVINQSLASLKDKVDWAFVFGSVASGKESSTSDIDLMVIGNAGFGEVVKALYPAQESLGREINPKVYRKAEWLNMVKAKDAFINDVLTKPRMDVIGDRHEFGKPGGQEPGEN